MKIQNLLALVAIVCLVAIDVFDLIKNGVNMNRHIPLLIPAVVTIMAAMVLLIPRVRARWATGLTETTSRRRISHPPSHRDEDDFVAFLAGPDSCLHPSRLPLDRVKEGNFD